MNITTDAPTTITPITTDIVEYNDDVNVTNVKVKKIDDVVISPTNNSFKGSMSLHFYTSLSQLVNDKFPIKGISSLQIETARAVLGIEDIERNKFVEQYPQASEEEIKQEQVESVLFLVGAPFLIDRYIGSTNLKWITFRGDDKVQGVINGPNKNNYRVTMLLLNVNFKRNCDVMKDVGWTV